jgi:shikimate dehydrogenase
MKAGLIGEKLGHSYSPLIHKKIYSFAGIDGSYSLFETPEDSLGSLVNRLEDEGFGGINITIPYKVKIMKYIDKLADEARDIGAVNTILFKNGKRYGHNTDYFGLKSLIDSAGFPVKGKRALILGTGGAARCAYRLLRNMEVGEIIVASRFPERADKMFGAVSYDSLQTLPYIDLLINTTPVGMSPGTEKSPASREVINKCEYIIDLIYNPMETRLLRQAKQQGRPFKGGLNMLCAQALKSQEIWNGRTFNAKIYDNILKFMAANMHKGNIVLIGMPGSGKTTVGAALKEKLGMDFVDTDKIVTDSHGLIPDIFRNEGEAAFRVYERDAALIASSLKNTVISTGGGMILDECNMEALKKSGIIIFLDRPLEKLIKETDITGRPTIAEGSSAIIRLYEQRHALYVRYADIIPDYTADMDTCVEDLITKLEDRI